MRLNCIMHLVVCHNETSASAARLAACKSHRGDGTLHLHLPPRFYRANDDLHRLRAAFLCCLKRSSSPYIHTHTSSPHHNTSYSTSSLTQNPIEYTLNAIYTLRVFSVEYLTRLLSVNHHCL